MSFPTVQQTLTRLIVRTDPDLPPATLPVAAEIGSACDREVIAAVWHDAAPDPQVLAVMLGVLDGFLTQLPTDTGLHSADTATCTTFITEGRDLAARHLRKNTLMAAYRALESVGAWHCDPPVLRLQPTADESPATRTARRPATSDEVLLARVCARLSISEELHRKAAALAIVSAGASAMEAPQVRWIDYQPAQRHQRATVVLAGRHHKDPSNGWHVARRQVTLDAWGTRALDDWHTEAHDAARPVSQDWSITYSGTKALTSPSAKNSVDRAVNDTLDLADLAWIPVLSASSLQLWAAAHAGLHHPGGLDASAAVLGVDPANALRKLTGATGRAYKPAA